ncbi:origin recognition complex subunit 5 C-terminus-domain-containing protein [Gongronella butleri]|nr:origin recognition complex subunit 5 C-terminus-domain-containing protein [Gongronella butleri]
MRAQSWRVSTPLSIVVSCSSLMSLKDRYPGRSQQIDTLISLMGQPSDRVVPSLFVYGHAASGKTSVVLSVLEESMARNKYAYVHCVENHTPRQIFERALNQWCNWTPSVDNDFHNVCKAENIHQFVNIIQQGVTVTRNDTSHHVALGKKDTIYLVLDRAERLRDMTAPLLPSLLRLSELTQRNVCVILISSIVFEKFRVKGGSYEPMYIRFPDYTKDDTLRILLLDFATMNRRIPLKNDEDNSVELDDDFFTAYVDLIYNICYHNCKNLNELRYISTLMLPLYVAPIQEGTAMHETARLVNHAKPYFAEATNKLYLREISSAEWTKETERLEKVDSENKRVGAFLAYTRATGKGEFDLPHYTKFLLVAAYLASYNPVKYDRRYFSRGAEERTKKKGGGTRRGRVSKAPGKMRQQLLGPAAFTVQRLMAIFYHIVDETVSNSIDVQQQISSLTTLRLLIRNTTMDKLDEPRYKCNVTFEYICGISKEIHFELDQYLYDFN